MKNDLLPCPFCGNTKLNTQLDDIGQGQTEMVIICRCGCRLGGGWEPKAKTVERWNRRVEIKQESKHGKIPDFMDASPMTREQVDRLRGCISQMELLKANLGRLRNETTGPIRATLSYVESQVERLTEHLLYGGEPTNAPLTLIDPEEIQKTKQSENNPAP